ncbi:MAG: hypothetical protein IPL28_25850 [Chloroflexi bacterium]|nr:hypothetical protein [Chloroflexota bacterium]
MTSQHTPELLAVWQAAVDACQRHLKIAAELQKEGLMGLKMARAQEATAADVKMWRGMLADGVRMERAANGELLLLHKTRPRVKGK